MILTICANPVLDTLYWNHTFDHTGRSFFGSATIVAGGFGFNAARALMSFEKQSMCLFAAGGTTGRLLTDVANEEGLQTIVIPMSEPTRVATHWLCGSNSRMLVSPSPMISAQTLTDVFDAALRLTTPADCILVGGSVPPEVANDYVRLISECSAERWVAIDIRVPESLNTAAPAPQLMRLRDGASHTEALSRGAQVVLSTAREYVRISTLDASIRIKVPILEPINPFGCGDSLIAVLASLLREGCELRAAAEMAAACAAANVLDPIPGRFDLAQIASIQSDITVEFGYAPTV